MNGKRLTALCLAGLMAASVLTGCGANRTVASTKTGIKAEYGVVNFMCRYQQAYMADLYSAYYGVSDWEDETYGLGDNVKDNVLDTLHELLTIEQHASSIGVALTADEQTAIKTAASEFMAANSKDTLKEMGATQEIVERYLTLMTLRAKAYNVIIADVDTNVSDEEANMSGYTILQVAINGYYDYSTYNYVEYTEEEVASRTQDAKDIFAAITDPADLETVAETYGYTTSTGYYDQDDTTLDTTVKEVLDGLQNGQMSDLIETSTTLYIVRMDAKTDAEQTESNRQSIIETRKSDLYDSTLADWQEDDGWKIKENTLKKIDFKDTFTLVEETEASTEAGTEN